MTLAGADDDATMGKAELLIPSCVQQCLVMCVSGIAHFEFAVEGLLAALFRLLNLLPCDMVHTSSFPSRSYVMSFKRLSNVDGMSVDWLLEAAP
ncbi:hypothetical protein HF325_003510 [Metschnikowia pulcherrima]|uniref:Uncharacterized protein n=1 Tax=Metschnikowia pulcherrima TaxID=27326 RepID=A0A8H7GSZ0_9ASCO|nr:hypothetical protein HF325_003510 [Metschnikowia pulcherrima]